MKVVRVCKGCKKTYEVAYKRRLTTKFCNRQCFSKYNRGPNNACYLDNLKEKKIMHRKRAAEWKERNKDRYAFWEARRRALLRNAQGSFSFEEWQGLIDLFKHTCPMCKRTEPEIKLSIDHIKPLSKGGSNFIENIQPLCRGCNSVKGNRMEVNYVR